MNKQQSRKKAAAALTGAALAAVAGVIYLYGPDGDKRRKRLKHWMLRAKADILERLENAEHLTEEEYHRIVDEALDQYYQQSSTTKKEIDALAAELKAYWSDLVDAAGDTFEEGKNKVSRHVSREDD